MIRQVKFIGAASGLGAPDHRCADGPLAFQAGLLPYVDQSGKMTTGMDIVRPDTHTAADNTGIIAEYCTRLARHVYQALLASRFPVTIGGDHSCAIGTWAGVHKAIKGAFGLIWVDAHMDSHTPATSPSGAIHGMPLASLLGYGHPSLTRLNGKTPSLLPRHVCLFGVRSYEPQEQALLRKLGVRVITMEEIAQKGIETAWREALAIVKNGTLGYGISIDLDAIDPADAPGVGSPEPGGIREYDMIDLVEMVRCDPELLALEIAEANPALDHDYLTLSLVDNLVNTVINQELCHEPPHRAGKPFLRP